MSCATAVLWNVSLLLKHAHQWGPSLFWSVPVAASVCSSVFCEETCVNSLSDSRLWKAKMGFVTEWQSLQISGSTVRFSSLPLPSILYV